ncbi:MAG TPA: caspase family protein [Bacteroidales bacterium]|jgi:hypothetical protein|nr:caspase family protein [Bacteroidales bacterium]HOL97737.1 caspase family protein [Bacteroidales bacterium]HOM36310.1 caspase family protein [Bacteroidales bacterium]HPD23594.1 caspase family protein [Bacteroidales bacterium]HRS99493.1 caspase family protein [Bacteroidales bacterium]
MKKSNIFLILLLIVIHCFGKSDGDKYAIIIAVGNYDQEKTGWYPINTQNDVKLIEKSLISIGFSNENIIYVIDEEATKQGIINAFNQLFTKIGEGDQIVIHYSGHGQQIFDDNGDEIDGLDEALVCYDAPNKMIPGYDGSKHFRDDELGDWINKFRTKLDSQGHVLVFLDCCHSGTGTRGSAKVRGGAPPLVPEGWNPPKNVSDDKTGFGIYQNDNSKTQTRGIKNENLAKFIVISGASANELNYETFDEDNNPVGSLSYCIYKAFSNIKGEETYRQIYAKILAEMSSKAPNQNPAIEGDIDYVLFNGNFNNPPVYFTLKSIKNDSIVEINVGQIGGINPGSNIAFTIPGVTSPDDNNTITTGKVISSTNLYSTVLLEKKYKFKSTAEAWAYPISKTPPQKIINVSIDSKTDPELKSMLERQINSSFFAKISNENPELTLNFSKTRGAKNFRIVNSIYNKEIESISDQSDENLIKNVLSSIQNYSQGKLIKDMDYYDDRYYIIMELIPVKATVNEDGDFKILEYLDSMSILDKNGIPTFSTDNYAVIRVTNHGSKKAFFNIIDIQPDGFINPIIPTIDDTDGREYSLAPGESAVLKNTLIMFGPPYGNEIFKVISSDKPMNITQQITNRGTASRGDSSNIFEYVLGGGLGTTRGASTTSKASSEKISSFEYCFKIVE